MTGVPVGPGEDATDPASLAGELRSVVNRLGHHLRSPGLRHGITPTRLTALAVLSRRGPLRQGDLAATLGISPASMTRLSDVLVEHGWVERRRDDADQRVCQLALTREGAVRLEELRNEGTTELTGQIDGLAEQERAALGAALPVLRRLADQYLDQRTQPSAPRAAPAPNERREG